ncbi:MAG: modulator protein, partial [Geminicoccaceae bacterium]|nr:modulator protein [Geminicoccaceae bacterium]
RVFVGKRQALVATGDLESASLDRLVENALAIARAVPEDRYAGLADADLIARELPRLDLDDGLEPGAEALAELAAAAEDAGLAHPKITNSEGAEAGWPHARARRSSPPTASSAARRDRATASAPR